VFDEPAIDGLFRVSGGRELALRCWGEGSPTVILETGHPNPGGIQDFDGSEFVRQVASRTTVCAYDRAGTGASDAAPNQPRTADDVIEDLDALLETAKVEGPYVLVGASFGGMIVTYYASEYPDDASGVVLLDVPPPSDELTLKEIPELAWDHPENPEHVDVIDEFEGRFARHPVTFEAPLVVVTASDGPSAVKEQRFWLEASPDSQQVEIDGAHDVWLDNPEGSAVAVLKLVEDA
jgi:pimeloyl-ACP methyl ester carboxylesterase